MITKLGKYQIRGELGRGAMGVVYEGFDPLIARVVALKTIRSDQLAGEDAAGLVARFRHEAQAAGRLSHPNIVSIYEFGDDGGVWFIAMEFVKGRELKESFDAGQRFTTADTVRIMAQILAALAYSHRQGVVHRDIKPANIFLLPDGTVKVADFGIAHIESSELTQVGTVLGTLNYMSPEQILGLPVDGRSDLFAAGVILYQFLTGERPFTGSATTTVQKVLKEDPLPPSILNVQVLPAFDAVVRRALAKRPEDRFADADEFAAALRAAAAAQSAAGTDATVAVGANALRIAGADTNLATKAVPPPGAPSRAGSGAAAPGNWTWRVPAVAVTAAIAAVVIGTGLWFLLPRAPGESAKAMAGAVAPATVGGGTAVLAVAAPASSPAPKAPPALVPGTMLISAVGVIDPADPRYRSDDAVRQSGLRKASQDQLVEKALALFIDTASLARNYDAINDRLLSRSGSFITRVVRESEPRVGKDGLLTVATEAVVDVKALQRAVNQMSRDERIGLIRARGDPKISVRILVRADGAADAPSRPSPIAENIIKAEIKSFGFRTWSDDEPAAGGGATSADFTVTGEVTLRKLSTRLEASRLVITKYVVTSATVKCIDRETGEEIYHNTVLPQGGGSAPSEDEALKAIGARMAKEFSRDFFLEHLVTAGQPVVLQVAGVPDAVGDALLMRELAGLPAVITIAPRQQPGARVYDIGLAGAGPLGERMGQGVLMPLNAKLGQDCFRLGAISGDQVGVTFDARCAEAPVLSRLETYPPAWLYAVPPERQRAVTTNPDTLRKLTI
jgi:serine/threonine-protein kinase